jgi:hypothetical protein
MSAVTCGEALSVQLRPGLEAELRALVEEVAAKVADIFA